MAKRTVSLEAIRKSIESPKTPASLKKGLIKKYGKQLGLTQAQVDKYMKASGAGKKAGAKKKAKSNPAGKKKFKPGDKVSYSGYHGTVMRHLRSLHSNNIYEVKIDNGDIIEVKNTHLVPITRVNGSALYIVTGKVHAKGMRDTISKPMSKARAEAFKKKLEADLKMAAPQYKWVSELKVQKANVANPRAKKKMSAWEKIDAGKITVGQVIEAKREINKLTNWPLTKIKLQKARRLLSIIPRGKGGQYSDFARIIRQAEKEYMTIPQSRKAINPAKRSGKASRRNPEMSTKAKGKFYLGVTRGDEYIAILDDSLKPKPTLKNTGNLFTSIVGPFSTVKQAGKYASDYGMGRKVIPDGWGTGHNHYITKKIAVSQELQPYFKVIKKNPPASRGTEIYSRITAIEAQKGNRSLWPKEPFRHDFKVGGKILGLPNGDLLIKKGKDGKRLWKFFDYGPNDGTRKNPAYAPMVQVFMERIDINPHVIFRSRVQDLKRAASELGFSVTQKTYKDGHEYYIVKSQHPTVAKSLEAKIKLKRFLKDAKINDHSGYYSNKPSKRSGASKHYIGIKRNKAVKIHSLKNPPTKGQYPQYTHMMGPFSSRKAAEEYAATH